MIAKALEYLKESFHKPEVITIHGLPHTDSFRRIEKPVADSLEGSTLAGLVEYTRLHDEDLIVSVVGPTKVRTMSVLDGEYRTRENFLETVSPGSSFNFGQYMPVEEFIVSLQAQFIQDDTTAKMLAVVGNLRSESGVKIMDDGVTQQVEAKTAITTVENVKLPNPIELSPYRTFREVAQPKSKFVIRIKQSRDGINIALFEADGGGWKVNAISNVTEYLREKLDQEKITVIS